MPSANSTNISPISSPIRIAAAGSTQQTVKSLEVLANSADFILEWVLTPEPKKVGRRQVLTKSPVQKWVEKYNQKLDLEYKKQPAAPQAANQDTNQTTNQAAKTIKLITISRKIDQTVKQKISSKEAGQLPDLLLVVDFGYFIPDWLLELPQKAVLNLHPSKLPQWRGGSPGQMVILSGQQTSAITLMRVTSQLDAGPIIQQKKFEVQNLWTSADFYDYSFKLAAQHLTAWLKDYLAGKLPEKKQPANSPTRLAREIQKQDAYLPWELIKQIKFGTAADSLDSLNLDEYKFPSKSLLKKFLKQHKPAQWAELIERASRAFRPWPVLWTRVNTQGGEKRMQIIDCRVNKKQLLLKRVKIAGQVEADWNQVKNGEVAS